MASRMRERSDESREQARRLEELLAALDTSDSNVRDTKVSITGNVAACLRRSRRGHQEHIDELRLEHFESRLTSRFSLLPSYQGPRADNLLRQSLREEEAMADWIHSQIPDTTQTFGALFQAGETAGR
jgi:ferritin-like metal-binding protein YciE